MEVQRIKVEGKAIDTPRNVERLWLEVEVIPVNCSVEGHPVSGVAQVEIYADRLGAVLERTRTAAHEAIYAQACAQNATLTEDWKREHRKEMAHLRSDEERAAWVNVHCNFRPEHQLTAMGYRTGLPPLRSCKVVHPQTGQMMDARKWRELDESKRSEWLVDAPTTPLNAAQRANEHLANTIARALERSNGNAGAAAAKR